MAKKVPLRMCVGCREMKPKKELLRVVRTPEGDVVLDPTGKRSGRGAYVCQQESCLMRAIKQRQLDRALATSLAPDVTQLLKDRLAQLPAPKPDGD